LAEIQLNKFGIVEKVLFNRKERKAKTHNFSSLRTLRLSFAPSAVKVF